MHRQHRERFLESLAREDAVAVIPTGSPKIRNHDCDYRFRPDSDFWYLTGFAEPDAVLVLAPRIEGAESSLFLREKDRDAEIWTGRRLGTEAAPERLGVDSAHPIGELWERLPDLLEGSRRLVYRMGDDEERDRRMTAAVRSLASRVRAGVRAPEEWVAPSTCLHEQRLVKSEDELALMRRAAAITTEAHLAAMRAARPGMNEREIDAGIEHAFKVAGSTGPAYTNIVAGGQNACILHYVENDQPLRGGDLLLIDAGAEWEYYAADVTRTFPVDGTFGDEQRALYEVVLRAQKRAIEQVAPGNTFQSVHDAALRELVEGLCELGLVAEAADDAIESGSYKRFFMHRTGHWLGLDVHDCGAYHVDGESRELAPGMVTTVEPGLYVAPDDETVDARWRGIGIRIEDDVVVTGEGNEVLTAGVPKEVEEVEAACQGAELQPVG